MVAVYVMAPSSSSIIMLLWLDGAAVDLLLACSLAMARRFVRVACRGTISGDDCVRLKAAGSSAMELLPQLLTDI